ncbi:hypothetical protein ACVWY2_003412 [Bradyrhizobium sp. JR6.1]
MNTVPNNNMEFIDIPGASIQRISHCTRDVGDRRLDVGWDR